MSVDCNIPTPCINPLVFLIKEVFGKVSDGVSISVSLDTVLDAGISITSSSNFCCPDCDSKNGFYFLGTAYRFNDLIEINGLGNTLPYGVPEATPFNKNLKYRCCVNYQLPMEIRGDYFNQFKPTESQIEDNIIYDKTPTCCSNDFVSSIQELVKLTGADDTVIQNGLVEASTFGGKSGLGIMLNFLKTISPALSKLELSAFFIQLFQRGIVVKCDGCDMTIMTTNQYYSYLTGFYNRS
jgi:hypothetical protein